MCVFVVIVIFLLLAFSSIVLQLGDSSFLNTHCVFAFLEPKKAVCESRFNSEAEEQARGVDEGKQASLGGSVMLNGVCLQ